LFLNLSIHFESSTAELGPGGIPTGGTFKVLKPAQAVQAASADGRYAVHAQKQAANDQRQRDMEIEQRAVKGTLQALAAELTILKADMLDPLEEILIERHGSGRDAEQ
jgi:hypothetical protein